MRSVKHEVHFVTEVYARAIYFFVRARILDIQYLSTPGLVHPYLV